MNFISFLIFTLYSLDSFTLFVSGFSDAPIVITKYGPIQGVDDQQAYMYLGIPFAMPPIDDLRWEEPLRPRAWTPQILNTTAFKPACPQPNCALRMPKASCPTEYSEDCLYLNVFVPKVTNFNNEDKAVMVFIHGGNFQYQGADSPLTDGRQITNQTDVIVVTIQYRLGALGFLVTGLEPDQVQGNFGIKDQRLAIQWVYENIENFGGDKSRITIFGQSAGGQSTTIHLLSEDMQQYINNVIIMSAPMSIPFRTFEETMSIYEYFAEELNCTARDVLCLRSKTVDEIVNAQFVAEKKITSLKLLDFFEPWLPWLDGTLVKAQLLEIDKWLPGNSTIKPFMIGTLTEECWIFIKLTWPVGMSSLDYVTFMVAGFKQESIKVLEKYKPDITLKDQSNLTSSVATKWIFACGSRRFLESIVSNKQHSAANSYYLYAFDYPLDFPGWDNFTFCDGHVCHGGDLPYAFDVPDLMFTPTGHQLAIQHMNYWANFAKTNSPNGNNQYDDLLNWPEYNMNNKPFIRFKGPSTIESDYMKDDCNFLIQ